MKYVSKSQKETEDIGFMAASLFDKGRNLMALYGGLGAGKTTFVKGVARALGVKEDVTSPTFAIVNEYNCSGGRRLYHFDLYRIKNDDDLYFTGFYDYLDDNNYIITEWSENIEFALPDRFIKVMLDYNENENERVIEIKVIV